MSISQLRILPFKLVSYVYRPVILPLMLFLPATLVYGLARLHGDWRYKMHTVERETVMRNLAAVLGEQLSPAERACVIRDYFYLRSCELVDMKLLAGNERAFARLVEIRGLEHLEAALAESKGVILYGAHFASYFAVPSLLLNKGFSVTAITRPPSIQDRSSPLTPWPLWQRIWTRRLTKSWYPSSIPLQKEKPHPALRIARVLRANGIIGIAIDVPPLAVDRMRATSVAFLGQQVLLPPGVATLAHLTGASVLTASLHRCADWRHQVLELSPPVAMDGDVEEIFGRCVAALETLILRRPAQWLLWPDSQKLVELGLLSGANETATVTPLIASRELESVTSRR